MKNLVVKFLNGKMCDLYVGSIKEVMDSIKECESWYGGRWFGVEDCSYKFIKEDWDGEEGLMLSVYGDRGGINYNFMYRNDFENEEEWIECMESDCEFSILYVFENGKLYERVMNDNFDIENIEIKLN